MSDWADATDALQKLTRAATYGGVQLSYQQAKKYAETVRRHGDALKNGPEKKPKKPVPGPHGEPRT